MRFLSIALLLISCSVGENPSTKSHPVLTILQQMKEQDYQYEIDGVFEVEGALNGEKSFLSFKTHKIVSKSGSFASFIEPENNPESIYRFSDGKFLYTVNLDYQFINSPCLEGIDALRLYPHLLLDDYFEREIVSESEMTFRSEAGSIYSLSANEERLLKWGRYEIKAFELGRSDEFRDPRKHGFSLSSADDCGNYFDNERTYNRVVPRVNEF
ncbi:MAG: hypothetical protein R8G66_09215 [Cytophagales bacterium]|nr:hypothetical protein [Cytophagales bacterium]